MRMLRHLVLVGLAAGALGQAPAVKGGVITGTVTTPKDAKGELDEVWVYLETEAAPRVSLGAKVQVKVEQRNKQFSPRITVIPIGARVFFPNRDAEQHSVFSPANKTWFGFDLGRYSTDAKGKSRKFLELGEFDIFCDIHKEMAAKVKTVPSHHFTRVVDGKFRLADIPPGTYKVVAWTPDADEVKTPARLEVVAGGNIDIKPLNLQDRKRSRDHLRRDGTPYGTYKP